MKPAACSRPTSSTASTAAARASTRCAASPRARTAGPRTGSARPRPSFGSDDRGPQPARGRPPAARRDRGRPRGAASAPTTSSAAAPTPALLVKLLDAGERLPVHFHPGRAFAREQLGMRFGKTEAWIILEAEPDAAVHVGPARAARRRDRARLGRRARTPTRCSPRCTRVPVARRRRGARPGRHAARDRRRHPAARAAGADRPLRARRVEAASASTDGSEHLGLGWDAALAADGPRARRHRPRSTSARRRSLLPRRRRPVLPRRARRAAATSSSPRSPSCWCTGGEGRCAASDGDELALRRGTTVLVPYAAGVDDAGRRHRGDPVPAARSDRRGGGRGERASRCSRRASIVKSFGRVSGADGRELHGLPGRGRRAGRRQRRRASSTLVKTLVGVHPRRQRRDPLRGRAGRHPHAPAGARRSGSRPSTRTSRSRPRSTRRPTCSSAARSCARARSAGSASSTSAAMRTAQRGGLPQPRRAHPGHDGARREHVRRPAPGHRDLARGHVGEQGRLHGRADRGARRRADPQRARPDQPRARPGPGGRADQPQHARGLRGRRPHRGAAARRARRAAAAAATCRWRTSCPR